MVAYRVQTTLPYDACAFCLYPASCVQSYSRTYVHSTTWYTPWNSPRFILQVMWHICIDARAISGRCGMQVIRHGILEDVCSDACTISGKCCTIWFMGRHTNYRSKCSCNLYGMIGCRFYIMSLHKIFGQEYSAGHLVMSCVLFQGYHVSWNVQYLASYDLENLVSFCAEDMQVMLRIVVHVILQGNLWVSFMVCLLVNLRYSLRKNQILCII